MKKNCSEHPADDVLACEMDKPPIGFTSQKEYISASDGEKAKGYGYGSSTTSQAEADQIALDRAREDAAKKLGYKISNVISSVFAKFSNMARRFHLVAPAGTQDLEKAWEGRSVKKPWDYKVTAVIPHLNTPEPLKVCIDVLRIQTERPYIIIIDTGSDPSTKDEIEALRDHDVEIHYINSNGWRHSSEPVTAALDLAHSVCKTEYLFHTHSDCFLRRNNLIEELVSNCDSTAPVIGYRMSPRDWATDQWEWMIGHTICMLHMPTIHSNGVTWSMSRMEYEFGMPIKVGMGWPDTETGFNHVLKNCGITPIFIGHDQNYVRQVDENMDHVRSHPGAKLYSEDHYRKTQGWMVDAIREAKERISLTRGQAASKSSPQESLS